MKVLITIPIARKPIYGARAKDAPRFTGDRLTAIRETWLKDVVAAGADYKLFLGDGTTEYADDEVFLRCSDRYEDLPYKTQQICKWALEQGYDFLYRTDDDSYVWPARLLASDFHSHDYSGYCLPYPKHLEAHRYCGAPGFWLSRRAMELVVGAQPDHNADDLWVGRILYDAGIRAHRDTRHVTGFDAHFVDLEGLPAVHPYIALHSVRPEGMYQLHSVKLKADTVAPATTFNEPTYNFSYGPKDKACPCKWCQS